MMIQDIKYNVSYYFLDFTTTAYYNVIKIRVMLNDQSSESIQITISRHR